MRTIYYLGLCLLTGCLARPHLDKQSFIFAPPPAAAAIASSGSRVLGIRSLQVAEPFEGRSFVYRTGEFSFDRDPYAEFMVRPAEELAGPVNSWFRQSGAFSAVVEAGSALKPDTLVEIQVEKFYGDFRPGGPTNAVLAMHFVFFDASGGVPGAVILEKDYLREIPVKARTPVALIEGWNQGLAQILDSATRDFGKIEPKVQKP